MNHRRIDNIFRSDLEHILNILSHLSIVQQLISMKSESEIGKTSYSAVQKHRLMWHVRGLHSVKFQLVAIMLVVTIGEICVMLALCRSQTEEPH